MVKQDLDKLSSFHTTSLRRIPRIFWHRTISNKNLLQQTEQDEMRTILKQGPLRWIGYVLRKDGTSIARTAVHWTPEGNRKRGRPKTTSRRTVEEVLRQHHLC